jgi:hypothetical protein
MRKFVKKQSRTQENNSINLVRHCNVISMQQPVNNLSTIAAFGFNHDFSRIPVKGNTSIIQPKLLVNLPEDEYEQEADRLAKQVMSVNDNSSHQPTRPDKRGAEEKNPIQTKLSLRESNKVNSFELGNGIEAKLNSSTGAGDPLPSDVRTFMEPRFGVDFSQVRVHTDADALRLNRSLNAQAFTHTRDIYFGAGKIPGNDALTAHELTHVLQQTGGPFINQSSHLEGAIAPEVQRVIELRPPGRGEASAFDRRDELVNRLNAQSDAIEYYLDGRELKCTVKDEAKLKNFDRQMMKFIDPKTQVLPMRLLTHAGRVGGGGFFSPVIADAFAAGYVDIDDLLATDDLAFQSILVHFLTERAKVKNYARRIGTPSLLTNAVFDPAHAAGHDAQAEHFRDVFNDPSIKFNYEEPKPSGTYHIVFKSHDHGYRVFLIVHRIRAEVSNSEVKVQTKDLRWLTPEDFLKAQAAAGAAG